VPFWHARGRQRAARAHRRQLLWAPVAAARRGRNYSPGRVRRQPVTYINVVRMHLIITCLPVGLRRTDGGPIGRPRHMTRARPDSGPTRSTRRRRRATARRPTKRLATGADLRTRRHGDRSRMWSNKDRISRHASSVTEPSIRNGYTTHAIFVMLNDLERP